VTENGDRERHDHASPSVHELGGGIRVELRCYLEDSPRGVAWFVWVYHNGKRLDRWEGRYTMTSDDWRFSSRHEMAMKFVGEQFHFKRFGYENQIRRQQIPQAQQDGARPNDRQTLRILPDSGWSAVPLKFLALASILIAITGYYCGAFAVWYFSLSFDLWRAAPYLLLLLLAGLLSGAKIVSTEEGPSSFRVEPNSENRWSS